MIKIPLSKHAFKKLKEKSFRLKFLALFFERYRKQRRRVLLENALDYRRSQQLERALAQFTNADVAQMSVAETPIGTDWRPFRVEHTLSGSLRGDYCGGRVSGRVSPNLLESSSVLFLQGVDGKTLRALIPNQNTAREMLATALTAWASSAGYTGYWHDNTHLGKVIREFEMARGWSDGLAHAQVIDMIDASCEKSIEERPVIRVMGKLLQDGVALATALEVNGATRVLLPTRFFLQLAANVERIGRIATGRYLLPAV